MLLRALGKIKAARDVGALFSALGYTPDQSPFGQGAWVVARWRGFRVVAVDSESAQDDAVALARTLSTMASRALAVAVHAPHELALAAPRVGAPGISRVLTVPLHDPPNQTVQHLSAFRPRKTANGLAHALRIDELLASEIAGERFFAVFRDLLDRMAKELDGCGSESDIRMSALLSLTRVLFLYFVQAKGWLDNRLDFLKCLLDAALASGGAFHRDFLDPLVFDTLNRPRESRSGGGNVGRIPYLNGGLFEPHPAELRMTNVTLSNQLWRDAFDTLFEKFRFCVREAHEVDAIAPDMLGRVFERVMDPHQRHSTGTFYTPENVVRQIVDATIESALPSQPHITADLARRIVRCGGVDLDDRDVAETGLRRLRVLDPAVGSGAFLLGALQRLTDMRCALNQDEGSPFRIRTRREVLRDNLFGVDLNPVAVRLAELRLWLAVVADDPTTDIERVEPLPNLDGVIRQGDSLIDPVAAASIGATSALQFPGRESDSVRAERRKIFSLRGAAHKAALRRLRGREQALALRLLEQARRQIELALGELAQIEASRNLFGERTGLPREQRDRRRVLERRRLEVDAALASTKDGSLPFFSYEVHAPDVLREGGFTVIVGNPPWVRAERLSAHQRKVLRERFTWWHSANRAGGYAHLPDLSIAFVQRCVELAAAGAGVGLLVPSKLTSSGYGQTARQHLVRETTIRYLHRVGDRDAARFGATTYPLAVVLSKRPAPSDHRVALRFDGDGVVAQRALHPDGPWILAPDRVAHALETFRRGGRPLSELAPAALGIKTGANGIFIGQVVDVRDDVATVRTTEGQLDVERRLLRRVVRGRDVRPFGIELQSVIVWAYDARRRPLATLPANARDHFAKHEARLVARSDYRGGAPWSVFRIRPALSKNRVIWPDIARHARAVALDATEYRDALPLNSCYVSAAPDEETALVIAAVINSTWARTFVAMSADEARGGYRRVNARAVGELPIPPLNASSNLIELSAEAHYGRDVSQDDIDDTVASALGLPAKTQNQFRRYAVHQG